MKIEEVKKLTVKDYSEKLLQLSNNTDQNSRSDARTGSAILLHCAKKYNNERFAIKNR